jgi:hypothetical protein
MRLAAADVRPGLTSKYSAFCVTALTVGIPVRLPTAAMTGWPWGHGSRLVGPACGWPAEGAVADSSAAGRFGEPAGSCFLSGMR